MSVFLTSPSNTVFTWAGQWDIFPFSLPPSDGGRSQVGKVKSQRPVLLRLLGNFYAKRWRESRVKSEEAEERNSRGAVMIWSPSHFRTPMVLLRDPEGFLVSDA